MLKMSDKSNTVVGLEKYRFFYGQGMKKQWVESNELFLTCVAGKYGQSVKASPLTGESVVTEVDEDAIPRFDASEETEYLGGLKHWEKKQHHSALEDYAKISLKIRMYFSTIYGILYGLSEVSLQSRM